MYKILIKNLISSPHLLFLNKPKVCSDMLIENNNSTWKQKAIARRLENKELNKRRKELALSRDKWKTKFMAQKERADYFESEVSAIKKKLSTIAAK